MPTNRTGYKSGKREAGYVSDALRSQHADFNDQCSECMHFVARDRGNECQVVQGDINPSGWCKWYERFRGDNLT